MKKNILIGLVIATLFTIQTAFAQHAFQKYYPPTDTLVQKKLEWWQGIKFGLLMHWGTYSQWGIVESWSLCPEDEVWCERRGEFSKNYFEYKRAYEGLIKTFNPVNFDPSKWAKAAKEAGMRYVVFTTKHHDGFCMFDTKQTEYKITSSICPFSTNPKSNIAKEVFNAFRNEGFGIGAYFSKPDWHYPDYWDPYFPPFDRNPNYDLNKYPEKWNRYKQFTANQIKELMSDYGKVDILWLDGGWVQPMTESSPRWGRVPNHQDIDMPKIVAMSRKLQPGLIVVDRAVEGSNQNYLTPEQELPDTLLPYPWETCMTIANSWSYVPNDTYKPARQLIHLLCKIVSRGGNFLLNIGSDPNGDFDPIAYDRLKEIGKWMTLNGNAIYSTKPIFPYQAGKVVLTAKGKSVFAIYLIDENETELPSLIKIDRFSVKKIKRVTIIGSNTSLKVKVLEKGIGIEIPEKHRKIGIDSYALVFKLDI
ncbi:MAG: alpha-L-fucosidase [Bacteroidales bacterium]|nr:MAG: alpha-L-fucosidase [Bacteroidales bacterium]